MPPIFFYKKCNYNYKEICIYHWYIVYNVEIIFSRSLLHYQHIFPPFCEVLHAGHVKLFAEASELFMHAVLQLVIICKIVSLECILQEVRKMEVRVCSVGTVGRMMEKRLKVQTFAGEVMDSVFWDSKGILLVESLKRSATINPE
jgi:Transposase.